jgi:glycosyl transferase family 25
MRNSGVHDRSVVDAAVVSLDGAEWRRAIMRAELAAAGIEARFHSAVDARTPEGAAEIGTLPAHGRWGAFQLHDRACTLSHVGLLRRFLEGGAPWCLVLEDDVHISPELGAWLADMSWWPEDADVVKIERWRDDRLIVALGSAALGHMGRRIARLLSKHTGGAGYIVTRAGAEAVVSAMPVDMPIDHVLFNFNVSPVARRLTVYQIAPALVVQGNEPAPDAASRARPPLKRVEENRTLRELRRGWHEIKVLPRLVALAAMGRVRAERIGWSAEEA